MPSLDAVMWMVAAARPGDHVERLKPVEHVLERLGLRVAGVVAPDVEGEAVLAHDPERRTYPAHRAHAVADVREQRRRLGCQLARVRLVRGPVGVQDELGRVRAALDWSSRSSLERSPR